MLAFVFLITIEKEFVAIKILLKHRYIYHSRDINKDIIVLGFQAYSDSSSVENTISIIELMAKNRLHLQVIDILEYDDGR